jgi:hypothetical protein
VRGQAEQATEFMARLNLNVGQDHVWTETKRGRHGGGTWAHEQVALAYAKRAGLPPLLCGRFRDPSEGSTRGSRLLGASEIRKRHIR